MARKKKKVAKRTTAKRKAAKRSAPQKKRAATSPKRKPTVAKRRAVPAKKKKKVATRPRNKAAKPSPVRRRDGAGHLDPAYAAKLRELSKEGETQDALPFVSGSHTRDDLAEQLAEEAVGTATSGEDESEDNLNQEVTEERGGPFVVTPAGTEFADGTDESNPKTATREPFPRT
jgi:hypothetical protein